MEFQPPLGGIAPALQCNRLMPAGQGVRYVNGEWHCGRPATVHIIWDSSMVNGIACDEHAAEARTRWCFIGFHPYSETCSLPGALWYPDEDICRLPDDPGHHLAQADVLLEHANTTGGRR